MTSINNPRRRSIMVVDDEALVRMMAVDLFEQAGFHVLEAANGADAARTITDLDSIHGLFIDIAMPGPMNGLELARIACELHPEAIVLLVSSKTPPAAHELPGCARFIAKPYDGAAVLRAFELPPQA
ncbi:MAG TPA: response regulator [Sphingomonas sp.]|uniref:response regulator n=1 Tax=Sphingomonas sp. TaxID=28214 RepID=UPI002D175C90|nr:response regulator [Sphingomonas sp.]HMI19662.1 response regulator [Sphingomonas sp.]